MRLPGPAPFNVPFATPKVDEVDGLCGEEKIGEGPDGDDMEC